MTIEEVAERADAWSEAIKKIIKAISAAGVALAARRQGYNDRLDESLGARDRGRKSKQSFKSRRAESKGARKPKGSYGFGKR